MKVKRDHIHITSSDPKKTADFYIDCLGAVLGIQQGEPGKEIINVDLDGLPIRISRSTGADEVWKPQGFGIHHIAINVDDLDEVEEKLLSTGGEIVLEKSNPAPGIRFAFIRSFEGVLFEITENKNE